MSKADKIKKTERHRRVSFLGVQATDRPVENPGYMDHGVKVTRKYFNRELSWLRFNHRVLQEAMDIRNPVYERIKFLAIFSSNLDEFFKVRVSEIRKIKAIQKEIDRKLISKPNRLLKAIKQEIQAQQEEFTRIFYQSILPELQEKGINFVEHPNFDEAERKFAKEFYQSIEGRLNFFQVRHKNPDPIFLKNDRIYLVAERKSDHLIWVQLPEDLSRFVTLNAKEGECRITTLDDILSFNLEMRYGTKFYSLNVSRDAGLNIGDEYTGNLLEKIKAALANRDYGSVTRALIDHRVTESLLQKIKVSLALDEADIMLGGKYQNLKDLFQFPSFGSCDISETFEAIPPAEPSGLSSYPSVFDAALAKDRLLYFPYHSFEPVVRFVREMADDPAVTCIKVTLYRISEDSRIVQELVRAAHNDKDVFVFLETKARFDEENNIRWGSILEDNGARVKYSYPGIKVHSKIMYAERRNADGMDAVSYIGTGNLNEKTATVYTDYGLITAHSKINKEVSKVFDLLEGRVITPKTRKLLIAPFNARRKFEELVEREITNAGKGKQAYIVLKMNSLQDYGMIELLYKASNAGVKVRLLVRGICCLVPGVRGQSEHIEVTSIVDRFLEHGRVYIFGNHGDEQMYIGSADWMTRNLDHRIEVITPILDNEVYRTIRETLELQLEDRSKSRVIDSVQRNGYRADKMQAGKGSQYLIYQYLNHE